MLTNCTILLHYNACHLYEDYNSDIWIETLLNPDTSFKIFDELKKEIRWNHFASVEVV